MTPKEAVLAAIGGRCREAYEALGVRFAGKGAGVECPFHCPLPGHSNGDQNPSASLNTEKGVWCCQTCSGKGDIFSMAGHLHDLTRFPEQLKKVAQVLGVSVESQNGAGRQPKIVETYQYCDESGTLLYEAVRFEPKSFRQRRPDGKGGHAWNLKNTRRVLYRLPDLQGKKTVYIVEGEKDADCLWELGIPATCNAMGAGKWREEYTEQLKAAGVERVVIIPDNDEAGEKHAIEIARNCFKAGLSVKIAHLTDLPSGGDVSDWLTAGNTRDDLAEILENISAYTPGEPAEADDQPKGRKSTVVCLADIEAEEVSWLWHPYIPIGKLTLLEGDPGVGKSWITLGIATSLSLGAALPGAKPFGPTKTLLYTVEDGLADTIRPRLDAMGADVTRVHAEPEPLIFDLDGLERIEADIKRLRPSLVIVDPIMAFMGAKVDINKANETRAVLAQLAGIAEKYGTSILTVRHLRKSESTKAMYRGAGSIDFTAAARSVLLVGRDPGNHSSCAVAHIKSNLAAMGPSLGYEIREDCFVWTGESDLTAEQLLAGDVGDEERSAKGEAESFLQDILSEGLVEARAVYRGAKAVGISDRTLKRAKKSLGVNSRRNGFGEKSKWLWELPYARRGPTDTIEGQECLVDNLAPFDESGPLRSEREGQESPPTADEPPTTPMLSEEVDPWASQEF